MSVTNRDTFANSKYYTCTLLCRASEHWVTVQGKFPIGKTEVCHEKRISGVFRGSDFKLCSTNYILHTYFFLSHPSILSHEKKKKPRENGIGETRSPQSHLFFLSYSESSHDPVSWVSKWEVEVGVVDRLLFPSFFFLRFSFFLAASRFRSFPVRLL